MKKTSVLALTLFVLLLSSCGPTGQVETDQDFTFGDSQPQAWIDAPLNESYLPLEQYEIVFHISGQDSIALGELSINNQVVESQPNPDSSKKLATLKYLWNPTEPGTYLLSVRAQDTDGTWGPEAQAVVYIAETAAPAAECEPAAEVSLNAACRLGPTTYHLPAAYLQEGENLAILGTNLDQTWWAVQPPDQTQPCWISGQITSPSCLPEEVAYLPSPPYIAKIIISHTEFYWGDHPQKEITIKAEIGGENPISSAYLIYRLQGKNQWYNTALINTSGSLWEGTLNARTINGSQNTNISSAILEYYLEATDEDGLSVQSQLLDDIKLKKMP
jgi:hypothetical protein